MGTYNTKAGHNLQVPQQRLNIVGTTSVHDSHVRILIAGRRLKVQLSTVPLVWLVTVACFLFQSQSKLHIAAASGAISASMDHSLARSVES